MEVESTCDLVICGVPDCKDVRYTAVQRTYASPGLIVVCWLMTWLAGNLLSAPPPLGAARAESPHPARVPEKTLQRGTDSWTTTLRRRPAGRPDCYLLGCRMRSSNSNAAGAGWSFISRFSCHIHQGRNEELCVCVGGNDPRFGSVSRETSACPRLSHCRLLPGSL